MRSGEQPNLECRVTVAEVQACSRGLTSSLPMYAAVRTRGGDGPPQASRSRAMGALMERTLCAGLIAVLAL